MQKKYFINIELCSKIDLKPRLQSHETSSSRTFVNGVINPQLYSINIFPEITSFPELASVRVKN